MSTDWISVRTDVSDGYLYDYQSSKYVFFQYLDGSKNDCLLFITFEGDQFRESMKKNRQKPAAGFNPLYDHNHVISD